MKEPKEEIVGKIGENNQATSLITKLTPSHQDPLQSCFEKPCSTGLPVQLEVISRNTTSTMSVWQNVSDRFISCAQNSGVFAKIAVLNDEYQNTYSKVRLWKFSQALIKSSCFFVCLFFIIIVVVAFSLFLYAVKSFLAATIFFFNITKTTMTTRTPLVMHTKDEKMREHWKRNLRAPQKKWKS